MALQSLRARVEPDRVLGSQIRRPDGGAYETEETYFREVLGLASWRTAYKRLAIGRMLMGFACELAWEMHAHGYWRSPSGTSSGRPLQPWASRR